MHFFLFLFFIPVFAVGSIFHEECPNHGLKPKFTAESEQPVAPATPVAELTALAEKNGDLCGDKLQRIFGLPHFEFKDLNGKEHTALIEDIFLTCLASYVQVPTTNPPGQELYGAIFLERAFTKIGIPTYKFETAGRGTTAAQKRWNLAATLTREASREGGTEMSKFAWNREQAKVAKVDTSASVVLMNHIDVIQVFPDQWESKDLPFSGKIAPSKHAPQGERFLWGRGTLDM